MTWHDRDAAIDRPIGVVSPSAGELALHVSKITVNFKRKNQDELCSITSLPCHLSRFSSFSFIASRPHMCSSAVDK